MQIYFFRIFTIVGLTFVAITKKHDHPVRAHVNFPSTNRYYSLPGGTISLYFHPADTSCIGYNSAISISVLFVSIFHYNFSKNHKFEKG